MLDINIVHLFLRGFPEVFLVLWSIYLINEKKLDKPYFISCISIAVIVYLIRLLPIQYGIHTIIFIIVIILFSYFVNNIQIIRAIFSSLIAFIILSISEWMNIVILKSGFRMNIDRVFRSELMKIVFGLPSLIIFTILTYILYIKFFKGRDILKDGRF